MKIGFLGAGNMGGAIIRGYARAAAARGETPEVFVFDTDEAKTRALTELPGVRAVDDAQALVNESETLVIALKPNAFDTAIPMIAACAKRAEPKRDRVFVSIAAGIGIGYLSGILGRDAKIVRAMPNTPAMTGEGMTALSRGDRVTDEEYAETLRIFESTGRVASIKETMFDAVTGISGSSPAYVFMYIQALIECGLNNGLNDRDARLFAAQSALGAAKMALESDESPEQLKINVCSPGGTTVEAVRVLEERGFADAVKAAAEAAIEKSRRMTR
ncbi:MAG: pyrroline-5-carboxylate reductase [Clostridiales Family XIII bacterium]|jgi:pyrroline-5-carboxylate reductase|nr:pyrroline-5-carboxylate reductase [Clostridiales Family XIII bacterium]